MNVRNKTGGNEMTNTRIALRGRKDIVAIAPKPMANGINEPVVTDAHDCDAHLSMPLGVFRKRVCLLCYPNAVKGWFYSK
jgi:hypothetical protein